MEQTIGKRIMQNRKRLGMTQDQLAEKLGVTAQAVSKWENDQSCPDISILGTLADTFGISTDALLGREDQMPVHEAEVVDSSKDQQNKYHDKAIFERHSRKQSTIGTAITVITVGIQLLLSALFSWELSFWSTLWPTALAVFGIMGFDRRFSFFRLGCLIFGVYFMLDNLKLLPFTASAELVLPAILVVFGLSLLTDALRKKSKPKINFSFNSSDGDENEIKSEYHVDGETLEFSASFGEDTRDVIMDKLSSGSINISFGDYHVDLSGIKTVSENCALEAHCNFGELTLLVPRRFTVKQNNSAAFGNITVSGQPELNPEGTIYLSAKASFGEINIKYI